MKEKRDQWPILKRVANFIIIRLLRTLDILRATTITTNTQRAFAECIESGLLRSDLSIS